MPSRRPPIPTLLSPIPNTPGVYLFYGTQDELLYVGKSKTLKARVRAHFRDRTERMMMSRVRRIETRETAGELGALLLESKLIKELKPMFNRAQRQRRRIVIAERRVTPQGYLTVHLRSVDGIDPRKSGDILGVFKHTTQAKEFLETAVKERRLCPVLLGLEQPRRSAGLSTPISAHHSRFTSHHSPFTIHLSPRTPHVLRPCFSYHLGRCAGACIGEEPPEAYNRRVEEAFGERRVLAWPYAGGLVMLERREEKASPERVRRRRTSRGAERRGEGSREEIFLVDNWVLVGSLTKTGGRFAPFVPGSHRFDYDTYKIILTFVHSKRAGLTTRVAGEGEWGRYLRLAADGENP